jgi:hypothetical protein
MKRQQGFRRNDLEVVREGSSEPGGEDRCRRPTINACYDGQRGCKVYC